MNVAITIQQPGSPCPIDSSNQETTIFTKEKADLNSQSKDESEVSSLCQKNSKPCCTKGKVEKQTEQLQK